MKQMVNTLTMETTGHDEWLAALSDFINLTERLIKKRKHYFEHNFYKDAERHYTNGKTVEQAAVLIIDSIKPPYEDDELGKYNDIFIDLKKALKHSDVDLFLKLLHVQADVYDWHMKEMRRLCNDWNYYTQQIIHKQ